MPTLTPGERAEAASRYPGCRGMAMDISDARQVDAAIAEIVEQFGRLDILVTTPERTRLSTG